MTAPFAARAAADITKGYEPLITGAAVSWSDWPTDHEELSIISAQITEDSDWTPRIKVEVTVAETPWLRAADVRAGIFLDLVTGYRWLDGVVDTPVNYLYLVVRELAPIAGTGQMKITATSAEALLLDRTDGQGFFGGDTIANFLKLLAWPTCAGATNPIYQWGWNISGGSDLAAANVGMSVTKQIDYPMNYGEVLTAACEANNRRWYVERTSNFVVRAPVVAVGTSVLTLADGPTGIVTDYQLTDALEDDYANEVWVRYTGTNPPRIGYAGPLANNTAPVVSLVVDRDVEGSTSVVSRNAAAQTILRQRRTYGRSEEFTAAMALWLKPDDTVNVAVGGRTPYRRLVQRVAFRFPSGDMTVITRNPV